MTNIFVPFDLSSKLKQAGFNEYCVFEYDNSGRLCTFRTRKYGYRSSDLNTCVPAPTYDQALSWLEDNKIFASIEYAAPDTNKFQYRIDDYYPKYRVMESNFGPLGWITVDTGKMVGEFAIFSGYNFSSRNDCTISAIEESLERIRKRNIKTNQTH